MSKRNAATNQMSTWNDGSETMADSSSPSMTMELEEQTATKTRTKTTLNQQATSKPAKMPLATKQTNVDSKRGLKSDDSKPSPKKVKKSSIPTAIVVPQTTPAMTFALQRVDDKLTKHLTPIQKINLLFPEWVRYMLFRREGAQSALDVYLSRDTPAERMLAKYLAEDGISIWRLMFLAECPFYNGVNLLTDKTEKYGNNGLSFMEGGGYRATAALVGLTPTWFHETLSRYMFEEDSVHCYDAGKLGGKVIMYHDNCYQCADLGEFKINRHGSGKNGKKRDRPSSSFVIPRSFTTSSRSDVPSVDEVHSLLAHMLTLDGNYYTVFADAAIVKLQKLAGYVGMKQRGQCKRADVLAWLTKERSTWEKLAREKIAEAEVDIGDLKQFTTWTTVQSPYTEQQLTQISSILKRLGRETDGRSKIEVFLSKANYRRLDSIRSHNSIRTIANTKGPLCAAILRHFAMVEG